MNILRLSLFVLAFALGHASSCSAAGTHNQKSLAGIWGGDGVAMNVTAEGAEFEFDCASAVIHGPISIDSKGNFHATGTYRSEHAAPSQAGENRQPEATFTGSVKGENMHLVIEVAGFPDKMEFTLTQGQEGRLTKCA